MIFSLQNQTCAVLGLLYAVFHPLLEQNQVCRNSLYLSVFRVHTSNCVILQCWTYLDLVRASAFCSKGGVIECVINVLPTCK